MDCPQEGGVAWGEAALFSPEQFPEMDSAESPWQGEERGLPS